MATRCDVRGCPHRFRLFTLDWPWRCPEHRHDHELADQLHRSALARAVRRTHHTMKGQPA
jgi:hypothetical protein